jgi:alkylation response protein AidB-like acyl-CoA dehydrogenase
MADLSQVEGAKCKGIDDFLKPHHMISEECKMFCSALREFINKEVIPNEDEFDNFWDWTERDDATFIHDIWKKLLIDIGLQHTFIPPEFGGLGGGSIVESCATVSEVSRGDFALACSGFISPWSIASISMPKPNEYLLKKFGEALCGKEICMICSAITEPHAGGSVEDIRLKGEQIQTTAVLDGDEWIVNGHKLWPSAYREAKWFRVICRVEGEEYPRNIAQIFIPADHPGVSTSKPYQKMGANLDTNGDIWFNDVRVPKAHRAQEDPEDDLLSVAANITIGRLTSSAFPLGIMKRAYEIMKEYADIRQIAGVPMKEHGVIVHELGTIAKELLTAEGFLYSVAEKFDHPEIYGPPWLQKNVALASACQNVVSDLGWSVINRCMDLMGSYGYSKEGKLEKLLRDYKITQIIVGGPMLRLTELSRYFFGTESI